MRILIKIHSVSHFSIQLHLPSRLTLQMFFVHALFYTFIWAKISTPILFKFQWICNLQWWLLNFPNRFWYLFFWRKLKAWQVIWKLVIVFALVFDVSWTSWAHRRIKHTNGRTRSSISPKFEIRNKEPRPVETNDINQTYFQNNFESRSLYIAY